jgi:YidC/Oxa1 family membrane protein insertase
MFELIDMIVVRPITNILFVIYNYVGDFGLAIILFTVIVRILMWPLLKRQLHQSKLMRKIQPELVEIKKRCKGNRQLETLQTMDLYKRYNIKPFNSILTLFIQLPILIALFTTIRVIITPTTNDHLARRAYSFVQPLDKVHNLIEKQKPFLENAKNGYDFHPRLFNLIDLDVRAGLTTISSIIILLFVLGLAFSQYYMVKQQQPSRKSKKRTLRQIFKETSEGKEPDQSELNNVVTSQMAYMMPIMMLFIMINLPGALVFYYLLSNLITIAQQKYIFDKSNEEMENSAEKTVLKELRKIQEAEIVQNKKTGTKITRISAKDIKRRKS